MSWPRPVLLVATLAASMTAASAMLASSKAWAAPAAAPAIVEEDLPIPPIPPEYPPADVAAPVPDSNLYAPAAPPDDSTQLKATLNERAPTLPGADPIPGSLYRYDQEQKRQFIPNPGIRLVVPLQK